MKSKTGAPLSVVLVHLLLWAEAFWGELFNLSKLKQASYIILLNAVVHDLEAKK